MHQLVGEFIKPSYKNFITICNECLIDYESSTVASSLSSSCQDTHESLTTKSFSGSTNKIPNVQVTPETSCHVENSEEFIRQKNEEDRECLKEAFNFLKQIAKHLKRGQAIVNTSMVFFLKYTRIHSVANINKYLIFYCPKYKYLDQISKIWRKMKNIMLIGM